MSKWRVFKSFALLCLLDKNTVRNSVGSFLRKFNFNLLSIGSKIHSGKNYRPIRNCNVRVPHFLLLLMITWNYVPITERHLHSFLTGWNAHGTLYIRTPCRHEGEGCWGKGVLLSTFLTLLNILWGSTNTFHDMNLAHGTTVGQSTIQAVLLKIPRRTKSGIHT